VLLAILMVRFGGLVPPQSMTQAKGTGLWRLKHAIFNRGGGAAVARFLHATPVSMAS
jgi:hypothetical protein